MKLDPKKFEIPSRTTYKLDLIREAAKKRQRPELGRPTILVAGTNGKGSTCAFLTALFRKAGLRVGTYSSPHIVHPEERIRINSVPISSLHLKALQSSMKSVLQPLTYFERWTLMAFEYFRRQKVDIQILEVGIGGRLDATNICEPDISLIATIDNDHKDVLGPTLTHIAFEKAGVMRKRRPTFALPQRASVRRSLDRCAKASGAELNYVPKSLTDGRIEKIFRQVGEELGRHQEWNARLAWCGFQKAHEILGSELKLSVSQIRNCFRAQSLWPARFQILQKKPIAIMDGGHNPQAIREFAFRVQRLYPKRKFVIVFGAMTDKPVLQLLKFLKPLAKSFIFPVFYPERQIAPATLNKYSRGLKIAASQADSTEEALYKVWRPHKGAVEDFLVVGSFYLAGDILRLLELRKERLWDRRL